jgi:hypothetical protein
MICIGKRKPLSLRPSIKMGVDQSYGYMPSGIAGLQTMPLYFLNQCCAVKL